MSPQTTLFYTELDSSAFNITHGALGDPVYCRLSYTRAFGFSFFFLQVSIQSYLQKLEAWHRAFAIRWRRLVLCYPLIFRGVQYHGWRLESQKESYIAKTEPPHNRYQAHSSAAYLSQYDCVIDDSQCPEAFVKVVC